jgi:hypothetical protein
VLLARHRLEWLLALFVTMVVTTTAGAAPRLAPLLDPGREFHAGEQVVLQWSELPRDADEMEILLALDDDQRFVVRVTAQIDPRRACLTWRVPNLAVEHARLRIRYGNSSGEFETAPSAPFRIVADLSRPPERELVHEGAWWTGHEVPTGGAGAARLQGSGPGFEAGTCANAIVSPARAMCPVRRCAARFEPIVALVASFHAPPDAPVASPEFVPLRI